MEPTGSEQVLEVSVPGLTQGLLVVIAVTATIVVEWYLQAGQSVCLGTTEYSSNAAGDLVLLSRIHGGMFGVTALYITYLKIFVKHLRFSPKSPVSPFFDTKNALRKSC